MINGDLRVQIGKWSKEIGYSEKGQSYSWMAWDTITSFPLLLNPIEHFLPPRFLLLKYFTYPSDRKDWRMRKREFFRRTNEYRRVLSTFGEYGEEAVYERQNKELKTQLAAEGFEKFEYGSGWRNDYLSLRFDVFDESLDLYQYLSSEEHNRY